MGKIKICYEKLHDEKNKDSIDCDSEEDDDDDDDDDDNNNTTSSGYFGGGANSSSSSSSTTVIQDLTTEIMELSSDFYRVVPKDR